MSSLKGDAKARLKDGRELTLAFDFDAMIVVEDMIDVAAMDLLQELAPTFAVPGDPTSQVVKPGRTPRLKEMRALIAGALHKHHPDLTAEDVGALILSDGDALSDGLGAAITAAFGDQMQEGSPADGAEDPPKRPRGAGRKR